MYKFMDIYIGAFAVDGFCLKIRANNNRPDFRPNTEVTRKNMIDYRRSESYSSHR